MNRAFGAIAGHSQVQLGNEGRTSLSLVTHHWPLILAPVLGLVVVDHQTGVNDAGDPAEKREQKTQEKTKDAAGHQDRDRRQNNAEEVSESFQKIVTSDM